MPDPMTNPASNSSDSQPDPAPHAALLPHLSADGRLTSGFLCTTCSYNLTGLLHHAACPECGTPVLKSVSQRTLALADPRWLQRVSRGLHWFGAALFVWLILHVGGGMMGLRFRGLTAASAGIYMLISLVPSLLLIYSTWLMTWPQAGQVATLSQIFHKDRRDDFYRQAARFMMVFALVMSSLPPLILGVLLLVEGNSMSSRQAGPMTMMHLSSCFPSTLMLLIGLLVLLRYLMGLAERIPGSSLPRFLLMLLVFLPGSLVAGPGLIIAGVMVGYVKGDQGQVMMISLFILGGLLTLGFLAALLMLIALPWQLGNEMRALAKAR